MLSKCASSVAWPKLVAIVLNINDTIAKTFAISWVSGFFQSLFDRVKYG